MTAVEELMALVQNFAIPSVEFAGSQDGVIAVIRYPDKMPTLIGRGPNSEAAALQLLETYQRKKRPPSTPTVTERL